jgi:hypothetical protein
MHLYVEAELAVVIIKDFGIFPELYVIGGEDN